MAHPGKAAGSVGQPERATQNRVIALFRHELGYRYLGDWSDRLGNSNIDEGLLAESLATRDYTPEQISVALHKLRTEANNHGRTLYGNNQAVYSLLRYGVPIKIEVGKVTETVHLINWQQPEQNDFAIAEEVTLQGNHERRPDIVLYVNGIAVGMLDRSAGGADPEVLLQDRLTKGKERLDTALETLALLCEPVEPPKLEYIHYLLRQHGDPGGPAGTGTAAGRALQGDRGPGARLRQYRRRTGTRRI